MIITSLTALLVGSVLVTAITMYFWPKIAWIFRKYIVPWFRKYMGNTAADLLAGIFSYIDNAMFYFAFVYFFLEKKMMQICFKVPIT